jgi:hypothetical protein
MNRKERLLIWLQTRIKSSCSPQGMPNSIYLMRSTDGTLGVYDLTKGKNSKEKLYALSDSMEEDLLAISLVKVTDPNLFNCHRMVKKSCAALRKAVFTFSTGTGSEIARTEFWATLIRLTRW